MMTKDIQIKVLQDNVLELQGQLAEAQKRIKELNEVVDEGYETLKKYQAKLSYYKNESL
jgi:uncharacterized coiled-coil protein SlyX